MAPQRGISFAAFWPTSNLCPLGNPVGDSFVGPPSDLGSKQHACAITESLARCASSASVLPYVRQNRNCWHRPLGSTLWLGRGAQWRSKGFNRNTKARAREGDARGLASGQASPAKGSLGTLRISPGAFADSSGISSVIQNTGNNVLIQNSTVVNLTLK